MRRIGDFLKSALVGGFFALLPLIVIAQLLGKALEMAKSASAPISSLFPKALSEMPRFPLILGSALVMVACLATGLLMRLALIRRFGTEIERIVLMPLPGYGAIKRLSRSISGASGDRAFKAALLTSADGDREFVYLIEDHGDGSATVLIPGSPSAVSGSVKIVRRDALEILDAKLSEVVAVLGQFGVGTGDLLAKCAERRRNRDSIPG